MRLVRKTLTDSHFISTNQTEMSNWISSKLKVAETFFEQIDQQAAGSLKKNERPRSGPDETSHVPEKTGGSVPLKDQLKKKGPETNIVENQAKLLTDSSVSYSSTRILNNSFNNNSNTSNDGGSEISDPPKVPPKPKPTLSDSDWTELLATPNNFSVSSTNRNSINVIRGWRKGGKSSGSNLLGGLEGKKNKNAKDSSGFKTRKRSDTALGTKLNGKPCDGEGSNSSARSSSAELQSDKKVFYGPEELEGQYMRGGRANLEDKQKNKGNLVDGRVPQDDLLLMKVQNKTKSEVKKGLTSVYGVLGSGVKGKHGYATGRRGSASDDLKRTSSSASAGGSNSESDSGSSSDSESELERERREKIFAEKAAARAADAIKERENLVARLEGEKQSLEKILEERAKQQAQEASKLQTTMMETMDAVEVEKQKHNNTRMEALARLAKLETANADLARGFATAQKTLEVEISRVAELRQQFELKEVALEELRRISKAEQGGEYVNQSAASKGFKFEREILEAEYSFLTDKIRFLEDKAKKLEENIEMTRKEIEEPTEVEIELKRRLGQMTDHLIQKQAQVEALSSEKATLVFRIEAVARLLDENKSMAAGSNNLESGTRDASDSKLRPLFEDRLRTGRKHLGSLVRQLDAIFLAGGLFLRRNPSAKLWCVVYLVCLHIWVIYILTSHPQAAQEGRSGAIISLENINNNTAAGL